MYFGLLGAGLVCIIIPFYVSVLLHGQISLEQKNLWGYWGSVGLYVVLGILLASPYILPFYFEYLPESYRGSSINFDWACNYQDTVAGSLCNFFNPFYSDVHGAFGGSVLIMVSALMPLLLLLRVRIPWPVFFIWMVCLITFILIPGSNTPLYYYFWKYFPLIRTFRVPGRLGIIFSFMNVLILTWIVHLEAVRFRIANRQLHLRPAAILAATALILFVVLRSFNLEGFSQRESWMPVKINRIPSIATVFDFTAGMVSLGALIFYGNIRRFSRLAAAALAAVVLLQVTVVLRYGTWVAPAGVRTPTFGMMQAEQSRQLGFTAPSGDPSRRIIVEHLTHTFLEHKIIARLCPKYTVIGSREEAYKHLEVERAIDHVFVENYPATQTSVKQSAPDAAAIDRVELKYNSFNNLKFDVDCTEGRFFVFSYPYSQYWRACVNGERVPVYRCNGIEQGIWLAGGRHTVEFRYWSWPAVIGVAAGSLSLFLTASLLLAGLRHKLIRYLSMVLVLCVCISAFIIWYHSLYGGNNIGTRYVWTSEEIQPHLLSSCNLAYGKPTRVSRDWGIPTTGAYFTDSSVGVDGDRTPENWFITNVQEKAWWQVDLGRVEPIGEIVLYKRSGGYERYGIPFDIIVSADGKQWSFIYRINKNNNENNWRLLLKNVTARYVRLQMLYKGYLTLAEVEIYGPK
jgi:hypothetical protein